MLSSQERSLSSRSLCSGHTHKDALLPGTAGVKAKHRLNRQLQRATQHQRAQSSSTTILEEYTFTFSYGDGKNFYYGTGYAKPGKYRVGQTIAAGSNNTGFVGSYRIDFVDNKYKTDKSNLNKIFLDGGYFNDGINGKYSYLTQSAALGQASGNHGLGSESDYIYGTSAGTGSAGLVKFDRKHQVDGGGNNTIVSNFVYSYGDGDYYSGEVYSNAASAYYPGQKITGITNEVGNAGQYSINSTDNRGQVLTSVAYSGNPVAIGNGTVVVDLFYDAHTNQFAQISNTPATDNHLHKADGSDKYGYGASGLGSESGLAHYAGHLYHFTNGTFFDYDKIFSKFSSYQEARYLDGNVPFAYSPPSTATASTAMSGMAMSNMPMSNMSMSNMSMSNMAMPGMGA